MAGKKDRVALLEEALAHLADRVAAIESALETAPGLPAISPVDVGLVERLRTRAGGPYQDGARRGAILYGGAVELDEREYLWEMERPAPGLIDLPAEEIASILGVLASPQRLSLLKTLLTGARSSHELQEALGISSPGQLYHHLKELTAIGIVEQTRRGSYQIAARHVIPFLTVLAAAVDLGASSRPPSRRD